MIVYRIYGHPLPGLPHKTELSFPTLVPEPDVTPWAQYYQTKDPAKKRNKLCIAGLHAAWKQNMVYIYIYIYI